MNFRVPVAKSKMCNHLLPEAEVLLSFLKLSGS
uniref:Uncharacterized protein n=1 Tax=Arundo donax TaxID=35708 RepID=A0A0A9BHW5_ARUDO